MLIVKVFVNAEQIDELHVQRTGEDGDWRTYAIRKPAGPWKRIVHRWRDGYRPLLMEVLEELKSVKGGGE